MGLDGKNSLTGKSIATSRMINTKLIILLEFLRILVKGDNCFSRYIYNRIHFFFKKREIIDEWLNNEQYIMIRLTF
jgi:hypothetical protein